MKKFGIAIHGGASYATQFIKDHIPECEEGLREAITIGFDILKKGGSAISAVEETVKNLEDNPVFNAGRGSALNNKGEVEMDASIMDGKKMDAGAVSMVRSVKNPISLARIVMEETDHVFLSGYGALELAIQKKLPLKKDTYFICDHQHKAFLRLSQKQAKPKNKVYGTVGAVALDKKGNLASGTSTGGLTNSMPGRIGDSCIIGAGCYANNKTCAVSATGEGEYIITGVIGHTISMMKEFKKYTIQRACDHVIHIRNKLAKCDMGIISIDRKGNFGITHNTQVMKRAWVSSNQPLMIKIW